MRTDVTKRTKIREERLGWKVLSYMRKKKTTIVVTAVIERKHESVATFKSASQTDSDRIPFYLK
jgi:hypothetical protein